MSNHIGKPSRPQFRYVTDTFYNPISSQWIKPSPDLFHLEMHHSSGVQCVANAVVLIVLEQKYAAAMINSVFLYISKLS